jgi:hypothetical protein
LRDIVERGPDTLNDPLSRSGRDHVDIRDLAERVVPARPGEGKDRKPGEGRGIKSAHAGPAGPRDPSGAVGQGWGVISDTGPGPHRIIRETNDSGGARRSEQRSRSDGSSSAGQTTWGRDSDGRSTRQDYLRDTYQGADGKWYTTTTTARGHVETQDGEDVWVTETSTTTTDSKGNIVDGITEVSVVPFDAGEVWADWDDETAEMNADSGEGGAAPEKLVDDGMRVRFHGVFCHPIRGCGGIDTSGPRGPRVVPRDPDGSTPASVAGSSTSPGPGAATDPNPDDIGRTSSGGGATIRRPSDGPEFGPSGPGAPPQ